MSASPFLAGALALLATVALSACQSTQDRSAQLEREGSKVLLDASGLEVTKANPDVKVLKTTVIPEGTEGAVVVEVENTSPRNLVDVPVSLKVLDAKGRSIYENDAPGLEQALVAIPYIPANGRTVWVNDQILAAGTPAKAVVKVGVSPNTFSGELPEIEVSAPTLEAGGTIASGDVVNRSGEDQKRLLIYAVARRGGEVVAAGRAAFEHLKPETKALHYHVYFLGDTSGAEVEISQFPTLPTTGDEGV
jgi:hypothetical protein